MIDPHLKWQLRRKLKQIHRELKLTLIYVTHDQVEALTFADEVVVMTRGRAVQVGSAEALFERPTHTFVGHFIGSPGMNFLPAEMSGGQLRVAGRTWAAPRALPDGALKLGVRPEYVGLAAPPLHAAVRPRFPNDRRRRLSGVGGSTRSPRPSPGNRLRCRRGHPA